MPMLLLTQSAAALLAQVIASPGLITDAANLYRCGEFAENHLSDIPAGPTQPATQHNADEWRAFNDASKVWGTTERPSIEVKEKTRGALKAILAAAIEKGGLSGAPPAVRLMRELGMNPDA